MGKIKKIKELEPRIKIVREVIREKDSREISRESRSSKFENSSEEVVSRDSSGRARVLEGVKDNFGSSPSGARERVSSRNESSSRFYETGKADTSERKYSSGASMPANILGQRRRNVSLSDNSNLHADRNSRSINEVDTSRFRENVTDEESRKYNYSEKRSEDLHVKRRRDLF